MPFMMHGGKLAVDGILNIDKPPGQTSFAVVARIRRLTGERRVGHGGTLDPAASGVLPVCLGQGTRVVRFLAEATKCYQAQLELGITTDTYDSGGKLVARGDPSRIDRDKMLSALNSFRGEIRQIPPMYSAVKHQGRRLYELARQGLEVERRSRRAVIHSLELTGWQPPLATIEVVCGKGTYIRSLAHDLGQTLGCGAVLKELVRLRCGPFRIAEAVPLARFEDMAREGYWQQTVYPLDVVLTHRPAVVVNEETDALIRNGRPVALAGRDASVQDFCRAYSADGSFLGLLRFDPETGLWHPDKVFAPPVADERCGLCQGREAGA